jgi:DNA-binding MarR family transcriptional regulator
MKQDIDKFDETGAGLANRLLFRLYQCANMLHKTASKAMDKHRITSQQWAILGALSRDGAGRGIAVGDLAAFLLVSRQNLAGVLSRLEALGFIERTVDNNDNRSRLIRLSEAGRHLWQAEMPPEIDIYYQAALAGFSTTDKIHAIHYLDSLLANFKTLEAGDRDGGGTG